MPKQRRIPSPKATAISHSQAIALSVAFPRFGTTGCRASNQGHGTSGNRYRNHSGMAHLARRLQYAGQSVCPRKRNAIFHCKTEAPLTRRKKSWRRLGNLKSESGRLPYPSPLIRRLSRGCLRLQFARCPAVRWSVSRCEAANAHRAIATDQNIRRLTGWPSFSIWSRKEKLDMETRIYLLLGSARSGGAATTRNCLCSNHRGISCAAYQCGSGSRRRQDCGFMASGFSSQCVRFCH